jgi:hypothetical protein
MVDYYQIVQRSVAALNPDTEATRQALYDRARAALAKQLCLNEPPVLNDNIRAELSALEEAIKKIESEAWSKRYEIKDKKAIPETNIDRPGFIDRPRLVDRPRPKRNAVFHLIVSSFVLAAGVVYFMLWMRFTSRGGTGSALVILLVFALPVMFIFVFVIYPILSPLLWVLRWLNKKLLRRFAGGEITANAAGATVLSAVLYAIGALKAPNSFSWWAAGWCWIGCVFPLILDPAIVDNLRAFLRRVQRNKAAPAESRKTPANEGVSATATDQEARGAATSKEALRNVA